jgi:rubrerythrin
MGGGDNMESFDLNGGSDIEDFADSLGDIVMDTARNALSNVSFAYSCPQCGTRFQVHIGENTCPQCNVIIDVKGNL